MEAASEQPMPDSNTSEAPYKLDAGATMIQSGRARWGGGNLWVLLAGGEETGERYALVETLMSRGSQCEPHQNEREDKSFYVLEGEMLFLLGQDEDERVVRASAGAFVWIPRGTRHAFEVESETARALTISLPAGFEKSLLARTVAARALSLPPETLGDATTSLWTSTV